METYFPPLHVNLACIGGGVPLALELFDFVRIETGLVGVALKLLPPFGVEFNNNQGHTKHIGCFLDYCSRLAPGVVAFDLHTVSNFHWVLPLHWWWVH